MMTDLKFMFGGFLVLCLLFWLISPILNMPAQGEIAGLLGLICVTPALMIIIVLEWSYRKAYSNYEKEQQEKINHQIEQENKK